MLVDLYLGKDSQEMFGMNRCKMELIKGMPKEVDFKKIAYTPKNRILNYFDFLTYTPYSTLKNRRKNAIAHILSQSEAHLLNFFKFKKGVVLCYDIIPLVMPYVSKKAKLKAKWSYRGMCKADHIIAISHFTKEEIVKHLGYPESKITVAHIGVDHNLYKPIKDVSSTFEKFNLNPEDKHVIYVGNEEPRMNIDTILRALKIVKEKYPSIKFIKVGRSNYPGVREKLIQLIKELGLEDNVTFTGYIDEVDLPLLYNASNVSVYMCEYAGFGLPPAESMACGTPTIGSNKSSIVEVMGDGITVDPKDHLSLAKEMLKILDDPVYAKKISDFGIEQAKKFTWKNFVDTTVEVYRKLSD